MKPSTMLPSTLRAAVALATCSMSASLHAGAFNPGPGRMADGSGYEAANPLNGEHVAADGTVASYLQRWALDPEGPSPERKASIRWGPRGTSELTGGAIEAGVHSNEVLAMNAGGVAVGWISKVNAATAESNGQRAARWAANATAATELAGLGTDASGNGYAQAVAINIAGTAAGYSDKYDQAGNRLGGRAVRWSAGGTTVTELDNLTLGGVAAGDTYADAIGPTGITVGAAVFYTLSGDRYTQVAVRWAGNGTASQELGTLARSSRGTADAAATGVNAAGLTIGWSDKYLGDDTRIPSVAVRWNAGSTQAIELGNLGFGNDVSAVDVNDAGLIVGNASREVNGISTARAVRWLPGTSTAIEYAQLGTGGSGMAETSVYALNASSFAAGHATPYDADGNALSRRAALWRPNGTIIDLSTLPGWDAAFTGAIAYDVSDTGFVTGIADFDPHGSVPELTGTYSRNFTILVPEAGTYGRGDANFDSRVNFADLVLLAQNYNRPSNGSTSVGDFNLDGITNFADLVALAQNYNTGVANVAALGNASLTADWALAQSLVPEPTALAGLALLCGLNRRRR